MLDNPTTTIITPRADQLEASAVVLAKLRPYQDDLVTRLEDALEVYRRVLLVLPTGGGKTVIAVAVVAAITSAAGEPVVFIAHRQEIADQISLALAEAGMAHGRLQPGYVPTDDLVQVGMVQTVARRLDALQTPALLVVDECHHAVAGTWRRISDAWNSARILGLTATPERLDGVGLRDAFDTMVLGPDVRKLIEAGYLAPFRYLAPSVRIDLSAVRTMAGDYHTGDLADALDRDSVTGDVVQHYLTHLAPRTAIAFCVAVAHAEHVALRFRDAGIPAASIDGTMSSAERRDLVDRLRTGALSILTSCELISEGFDAPAVGGAILLRPTQSFALYRQQIGRCLRPKADGSEAVILDHVANVHRHGLPDAPHAWSLDSRQRSVAERKAHKPGLRICKACSAVFAAGAHGDDCGIEHCLFTVRVFHERTEAVLQDVVATPSRWVRVHSMRGGIHEKPGRPPSFRLRFATDEGWISEFLALEHEKSGARWYAGKSWARLSRMPGTPPPTSARDAYQRFAAGELREPERVRVERDGPWWRVLDVEGATNGGSGA